MRGVQNPGVVDLISPDDDTGEVVLTILEEREWGSVPTQLNELQEKLNSYLSYVLDGFLVVEYPQYKARPVRVDLDCAGEPRAEDRGFLTAFRNYADTQSIRFVVCPREARDS
jgi:hypothetical protein